MFYLWPHCLPTVTMCTWLLAATHSGYMYNFIGMSLLAFGFDFCVLRAGAVLLASWFYCGHITTSRLDARLTSLLLSDD